MTLQIYNVLTRQKEPFSPLEPGKVSIYVCGLTVYGRCHVGHLRSALAFDVVVRYLNYKGFDVRLARNITDIDDKIIARAQEISDGPTGTWREKEAYSTYDEAMWAERFAEDRQIVERQSGSERHLAEVVADYFIDVIDQEDFAPFDLHPPHVEPRVSEQIPEVVALIEQIIDRRFAYVVEGDVYFDVPAYHQATGAYGKLSGRDYTQLIDGARVAPIEKKHAAPDFALWKAAKPGEPAWPSPWGPGRPGWHIECSAMSVRELGQPFDIHGGGKDLIFPHHENEIAQSEAAAGKPLCTTWMHNGFVTVDGVKMSKSLGNFVTVKQALEVAPPEVWRWLMLSVHYAKPIDLSHTRQANDDCETIRGSIEIAWERLDYFYETLNRVESLQATHGTPAGPRADDPQSAEVISRFEAAMDDDFNTARALSGLGEGMRYLNELCDMKKKQVNQFPGGKPGWWATIVATADDLVRAAQVLGLLTENPAEALERSRNLAVKCYGLDEGVIVDKINARAEARQAKDWARADALREELLAMRVEICDTPSGTTWKVRR